MLVTSYSLHATADFVGFSMHFLSFLQNSLLRDAISFVLGLDICAIMLGKTFKNCAEALKWSNSKRNFFARNFSPIYFTIPCFCLGWSQLSSSQGENPIVQLFYCWV